MNLVLNAKDAIPQGGVISIKTEDFVVEPQLVGQYTQLSPGSYVFIEVRDQGVGISENDLAHIFEPFFTSKAMGEGTGLGLTNVCHIIKNHDGFVSCESSLGEGARFQLFIPATPIRSQGHSISHWRPRDHSPGGRRRPTFPSAAANTSTVTGTPPCAPFPEKRPMSVTGSMDATFNW